MITLKKNQSGFGVVEVILVIAIIAILGVVGWYVLGAKKNTTTSYNNAASSSNTNTNANNSSTKYLTIKDEGIKIKLSKAINDAYYNTESGVFGVHSLDKILGCVPHKVSNGATDIWKGI